jgi:DNA-binding NarL/FixJ family response regulator
VDDHPLVREWLTTLIQKNSDLLVCGEAADVASALTGISLSEPDLAIVDLSLGPGSGLELIRSLCSDHPGVKVIVLSMHEELVYAERTIRAGASGFIMKRESAGKIIEAIRSVLDGNMYVSSDLMALFARKFVNSPTQPGARPISELSDREFEVFKLLGQGYEIMEIAKTLDVNHKTIHTYCMRIREKLKLETSAELLREALRWSETTALG